MCWNFVSLLKTTHTLYYGWWSYLETVGPVEGCFLVDTDWIWYAQSLENVQQGATSISCQASSFVCEPQVQSLP